MLVVFKKNKKTKKKHIQWVFWDGFLSLFFWVDFFYWIIPWRELCLQVGQLLLVLSSAGYFGPVKKCYQSVLHIDYISDSGSSSIPRPTKANFSRNMLEFVWRFYIVSCFTREKFILVYIQWWTWTESLVTVYLSCELAWEKLYTQSKELFTNWQIIIKF